MEQNEFITRKPNIQFLNKYISYYYFHRSFSDSLETSFIYYPGIKNALTIYKGANAAYGIDFSRVVPDKRNDFIFIYSGIQKQARKAYITSPFDKIGIVFNQLGINHFISIPLSTALSHPVDKSFHYFDNDLKNYCSKIYEESDYDRKTELLDQFFKTKYNNFEEPILKKCVQEIINTSGKLTVKDLSLKFHVSRKTLLRLFQTHMACSIKDYIDIVRFRKAMNEYILLNRSVSLTEMALSNGYYDQSHFINHFKKFTGINPKLLFKNIRHVGKEGTFWTFHN